MAQQIGTPGGTPERPALFFEGPEEFRAWLAANHEHATELWMGLRKKHVAERGLTWHQAVPEALCFGWIDSVVQRIDEDSTRQRWTPRRPGSIWSTVNLNLVQELTQAGRMRPAGQAAYERRIPEKSGIYAYVKLSDEALPPEYAARLAADDLASRWLAAATPTYRRIAIHWVLSAKQQATRDKRMGELIEASGSGQLIKSQRYGDQPAWVARNRAALGIPEPGSTETGSTEPGSPETGSTESPTPEPPNPEVRES